MINIEEKVKKLFQKSAYQAVKIQVVPIKGEPFEITSLDIEEGSFSIQMDSILRDTLEIGSMTASELKMTLLNPYDAYGFGKYDNIFFAGAKLKVTLLIFDDETNKFIEMPFGVFTIDQQPRVLEKIEIAALDNMIRLDIPFDATGLPDKMSLKSLVNAGLTAAGLGAGRNNGFPDLLLFSNIITSKIKSKSPITWRQVLMWCCECAGVCGIADEKGRIQFKFYEKYTPDILQTESDENLETEDKNAEILLIDGAMENDFPLTSSIRYVDNSELGESDIVITGFQFKVDDQVYPSDAVMDYGLQSEGNLVFYAATAQAKQEFAKRANNAVAGLTYRPYSCKIFSFPHLQLFDSVNYIKDGKHYHSIITNITFKLNDEMSISAKAKSAVQKGYASFGALTDGQRAIIDSVSRRVDETQAQLSDYETALLLFNAHMISSLGLFKTTKSDTNGGTIVYFHNLPVLEESKVIYMFGAAGVAWTMDGWNDGSPVWHYGFTNAGDAILNTVNAYIVSADLIKTGLLQSQNGASWINMDNGTFCFGSDAGTALALDENKQLNVYGTLKSIKYPNYSVSIGKSQNEGFGSWVVSEDGVGDLMAVRSTINQSGNGALWSVPMLADQFGANIHGIWFYPDQTCMLHAGGGRVVCNQDEAFVSNGFLFGAYIGAYKDNISMGAWNDHGHCWFNFFEPTYAPSPIAYDFGNGTGGGHAELYAAKYNVESSPSAKENINEIADINALDKINSLKFYRYDYKNEQKLKKAEFLVQNEEEKKIAQKKAKLPFVKIHEEMGIMTNEAPTEIVTGDGKAIDLYAYIGLTAKAVQELNAKVEQQEMEIAELKAEIEALKRLRVV